MSLVIGHPGTRLRIKVPYSGPPPSTNEHLHWAELAERLAPWRASTAVAAGEYRGPKPLAPSLVRMTWPVPTRGRRDPHNWTGTLVKACVDECVTKGLWPDDTPEHVTIIDSRLIHLPGLDDPTSGIAGRAHAFIDIVPLQRLTDALAHAGPELVELFKFYD